MREVYDLLNWCGESGVEGETEEPVEADEDERTGKPFESDGDAAEPGSGGIALESSEPMTSEQDAITLVPA